MKMRSVQTTKIDNLPDHLLDRILSLVEKKMNLSLVCRKWYELDALSRQKLLFGLDQYDSNSIAPKEVLPALLSRFPNLNLLKIWYAWGQNPADCQQQVDDQLLLSIPHKCSKLKRLTLDGCRGVTNVGIGNLILFHGLRDVNLMDMPSVSETGLLSLLSFCHSLKSLQLCGLENVKGIEWLKVVGVHCKVERLVIAYCEGVKESYLRNIAHEGWRSLRDFEYTRSFREYADESLVHAWTFFDSNNTNSCPNLENLVLENCISISRTGVLSVIGQCTSLRSVTIENCTGFQDEDLRILTRNNLNLSYLYLTYQLSTPSRAFTNQGFIHIAQNSRCLAILQLTFTIGGFGSFILESGLVAIVVWDMASFKVLAKWVLLMLSTLGCSTSTLRPT